jgi:hypothetical protein
MKVTQANKFTPVVITLETEVEVWDFKALMSYGATYAERLKPTEANRAANTASLGREIWNAMEEL